MKILIFFTLGFLTGLAIYQGPKLMAPLFQDQPETPAGHKGRSRYWNGGIEVTIPDTNWPLGYRTVKTAFPPAPITDPEAFEEIR